MNAYIEIKSKAELAADLIAEWLKHPKDKYRLNQLTFQACLWLPSDLVRELAETLMVSPNANYQTLVTKVRHYLLEGKDDILPSNVISFPNDNDGT